VVRVFVTALDGRTMTIRYCRPGALIGAAVSERVLSFVWELSGSAFATVRQRVARHLLDLASERVRGPAAEQRSGSELVVKVSQRELAEAVGTAREVVVRVLRELRQEGVVRTGRDQIVIADPARLIQEYGWNPSS
jgi:CRP/FNR family transcriptional regulator, cyclic AMP receptor protein